MALPTSYTLKTGAVPAYFDAMLEAQPPERFSIKFLENLGFTSSTDRLFIGVLKDLGFLNQDATPQPRYFAFLDRSRSRQVVAEGIRDEFSDLFAINTRANELSLDEARNKLRTLYAGQKTNLVISNIAKTFRALCDYADFSEQASRKPAAITASAENPAELPDDTIKETIRERGFTGGIDTEKIAVSALQYHINIVLPETRDQAVFDAIFRSLRIHLG